MPEQEKHLIKNGKREGPEGLLRRQDITAVPGYGGSIAPKVTASYVNLDSELGECAIRIKMSNDQFCALYETTKQTMQEAAKGILSIGSGFSYYFDGYGELKYFSYEKGSNAQVVNALIEVGARVKRMLEAVSDTK